MSEESVVPQLEPSKRCEACAHAKHVHAEKCYVGSCVCTTEEGDPGAPAPYTLTVSQHPMEANFHFLLEQYSSGQHMNLTVSQAQHLSDGIQQGIKFLQNQDKPLVFDIDTGQEITNA